MPAARTEHHHNRFHPYQKYINDGRNVGNHDEDLDCHAEAPDGTQDDPMEGAGEFDEDVPMPDAEVDADVTMEDTEVESNDRTMPHVIVVVVKSLHVSLYYGAKS
jgi:hypothetical protein